MINPFVSTITKPTLAILLRLVYFPFNRVGPYGVLLCCYEKRFSFLSVAMSKSFYVRFHLLVTWNIHTLVFLPNSVFDLLYRGSLCCLWCSLLLTWLFFYVVFKFLYWWSTLSSMLVCPLPPFLDSYNLFMSSLGCKALCIVISFLVLWFICLFCRPFLEFSLISYKGDSLGVYHVDETPAEEVFSFVWDIPFFWQDNNYRFPVKT